MTRHHYSIALTTMCVFLGVIIGVQFNTVKKQRITTENQRLSEVTAALKQVQTEKDALLEQNAALEKTIKEYQDGRYSGQEMDKLRIFAGLTSVSGGGVKVIMNDSSTKNGGDSNAYLVHAEDLLSVVNELNAAGAEAVSINGQRYVGRSAITCAGSIVMVNGVRVAAPFELLAVGEADVMQSALYFPGGVVDNLAPWGIEVSVSKESMLTVPAYTQTVLFKQTEAAVENTEEAKEEAEQQEAEQQEAEQEVQQETEQKAEQEASEAVSEEDVQGLMQSDEEVWNEEAVG